jgi:hypothetical protein
MAYTPEQVRRLLEPLWGLTSATERAIAGRFAQADGLSIKALDSLAAKATRALEEVGVQADDWAMANIRRLYQTGVTDCDTAVRHMRASSDLAKAAHSRAAQNLEAELRDLFEAAVSEAQRVVRILTRSLQGEAITAALRGSAGQRIASLPQLMEAVKGGRLLCYRSESGQHYGLAPSIRGLSQTAVRDTVAAGARNRMRELGLDLAVVSSHGGSCPRCAPFEGMTVSVDGQTPGYMSLDEIKQAGCFHHNCYHRYIPKPDIEPRDESEAEADRERIADELAKGEKTYNKWAREAHAKVERRRQEAMDAREPDLPSGLQGEP